ncbi:MAG: hypothetical protein IJ437_04300 [Clostridia bacterium]|nr:hypothetical protein [Clostridia bacterium]
MKKTNSLFNIFLSITLFSSVIALIFASLSLSLRYSEVIANIKVNSPISIVFIIFMTLSVLLPVVQAFVIKDYKITRIKNDTIFSKISSILVSCLLFALSIADLVSIGKGASSNPYYSLEIWKLLRAFIAVPFILSLIFNSFLRNARIPAFVRYACSISPIAWTLFSVLAIYFHKGPAPMPEFFRIMFSLVYIFSALFFLYDFKWNYLTSNTKFYVAISTIFTSFSFIVSISSLVGLIFGLSSNHIVISAVEMIASFSLGIYSLARLLSIKRAVSITAKQENAKIEHCLKQNEKK